LKFYLSVILILTLFTSIFIFIVKPHNLGVSPDSVFYIEAAKNFSEGKGIVNNQNKLINHWPPVYPIVLGTCALVTGADVFEIGIYLNAFLIILYGFILVVILKELKLPSILSYLLLLLLIFGLPTTVYQFFWSEGLFLVFFIATILFFVKWTKYNNWKFILLAGIFSGLFFITRYAGIGFIAGFSLFTLIRKNTIHLRIRNLIIYLLPIVIAFLIWHLYANSFGQQSLDRKLYFKPIEFSKIKMGLSTLYHWFISYTYISLPLLITIFVYYILELKKYDKKKIMPFNWFVVLLILLIFSYLSFLIFSILTLDSLTPLDNRILSPIFPVLVILLGLALNFFIQRKSTNRITYILIILLITNALISSLEVWKSHYQNGKGFTNEIYTSSEMLKNVSQNEDITIFSNHIYLLRFYSTSKAKFLPRKVFQREKVANKAYKKDIDTMKQLVSNGLGEVAYFNHPANRYLMLKEDILKEFKHFDIKHLKDGIIVRKPK